MNENEENFQIQLNKIYSMENEINILKERMINYNNILNENFYLNQEIKKLNETLKMKDKIISEFENLSEKLNLKLIFINNFIYLFYLNIY